MKSIVAMTLAASRITPAVTFAQAPAAPAAQAQPATTKDIARTRFRNVFTAVLAAGALAASTPGRAHHAFAAEFDGNKPVQLKGSVTKIKWTNPHGWIYIDVKGEDGNVTSWAVEFGSPYSLLQKGMRIADFPVGTEVVVKGHRAKSGKTVANASSVTLPSGRNFFTGAEDSPDAAPRAAR
jgi:hypothetical protein